MEQSTLDICRQIGQTGGKLGAERVVLFGSRARGDSRPRSDIDIAVYGMPAQQRGEFWCQVEDLPTLLKIDIVHVSPRMEPEFLRNIQNEGVVLYEKD